MIYQYQKSLFWGLISSLSFLILLLFFINSNQSYLQIFWTVTALLISVIYSLKSFVFMVYTYKRLRLKGFKQSFWFAAFTL